VIERESLPHNCSRLAELLRPPYAAFFFAARNAAHRARCAAAIRFRPAADMVRFAFGV
jgi:hypothetical protein